uniref:Asvatocin n=1 Tax=Scyliorhinus canicula TaxID=7830 RepID=OXYA_SCYCA|nr:RecName: Full=Asvatocin [Scyliorhinus canicula]
CYINNCPVG